MSNYKHYTNGVACADSQTYHLVGHCKLQQVGEYQLYGNVESMDSVELVDSCREALLVAFSSAKVMCICGVCGIIDTKVSWKLY